MSRIKETLTYVNEAGESVSFSTASIYHVNIKKDVAGLSNVQSEIYRINSMGQDGDTYLGNRIKSRDIEVVGKIKERNDEKAKRLRRELNHILNPQYSGMLIYQRGDFKRAIKCKVEETNLDNDEPILERFILQFFL